ncbi:ABC-2 transporter permease [Marinicella rhabdoformis]|uniref:ABC-2 transporter permease n=1 Tax=Marinicella rhabdoformis TaxID=2580566 RepID=UPI0012AEC9A0|nr:ABC-2 transporter permease [Marinicella rhabdoformis]
MNKAMSTEVGVEMNDVKGGIVGALVRKDWALNKQNFWLFSILGLLSVSIFLIESTKAFYLAMTLILCVVILIGALLVFSSVVNEHKEQTMPFIMSLPVTCMDYTKGKLIFNLGAYSVAWCVLTAATLAVIAFKPHLSNGLMPIALIVLIQLFVSFLLVLGTSLVTGSEKWTIVVTTFTNISVSLFMFWVGSFDGIYEHLNGGVAVWNSTAMTIIVVEMAVALFIVATTFYLQSRKKDFI